jgi:adenylate kinase
MIGVVEERLRRPDARRGFVLDGFPRTVPQAMALDDIVSGRPLIVVHVVVPETELVRRMTARRICSVCGANAEPDAVTCGRCGGELILRADDGESAIRTRRLRVYSRQTEPIIDFYRERPTFRTIDGAQAPDRVARDLAAAIDTALVSAESSS